MDEDFLEPAQAARIWETTPATARRWGDEGRVPMIRTAGGQRLFKRLDVIAFKEEREKTHAKGQPA
jgi:predicted site-specific integrase-resolvase